MLARLFLLAFVFTMGGIAATEEVSVESDLYYAISAPFELAKVWELRASAGYDYSDPHLNLFVGTLGVSRFLNPSFALGFEGSYFAVTERDSARTLKEELSPYGYATEMIHPDASLALVTRFIPFSGLVNFLGETVMSAELSLSLRGGLLTYSRLRSGPLGGTAVEFALGITPSFGVTTQMSWEWEKPPGHSWKSRAGFRIGPVWRF